MKINLRTFLSLLFSTACVIGLTAQSSSSVIIDLQGQPQIRQAFSPAATQGEAEICGMQIGKSYTFYLGGSEVGNTGFSLTGSAFSDQVSFVAQSSCRSVPFSVTELTTAQGEPLAFSAVCNDCQEDGPPPASTNSMMITAVPNGNASMLVQDIFIGGDCFDTSNAQVTGDALSVGTFTGAAAVFGPFFNDGIVLSNGFVQAASGPSTSHGSSNTNSPNGDPDLETLTTSSVNDVAILEFDFVPTVDQVSFEYVFASEEYCDYAPPNGSAFNDIFGFFLSGPGISGTINIAQLPGTGTPVSINNVNPVTNPTYFVPNGADCGSGGVGASLFGFDGFTTALTAVANVVPCETYHIKLAIADGGDSVFDSAVFLKANSFDAGGAALGESMVPLTGSSDSYESDECGEAFFTFTREGGNILDPVVFEYEVSGTATPGVDFTGLPPSPITIPAGAPLIQVPIQIIQDDLAEGMETVTLFLFGACTCEAAEVSLNIFDTPEIDVQLEDTELCDGLPLVLTASGSGGVAPYFYDWGDGPSPAPVFTDPDISGNTSYTVTVTDLCGGEGIATSNVTITNPEGVLDGSASLCGNSGSATLDVNFSGSDGPFEIVYSIDGVIQDPIDGITDNPYALEIDQTGVYALEFISTPTCLGEAAGTVTVAGADTTLDSVVEDAECAGTNSGSVNLTVGNATGAITYLWSNGSTLEDQAGLAAGSYTVTVTADGCEIVESFTIEENPPITADIDSTNGVDCANPTAGAINISASGGSGTLSYLWSNGSVSQNLTGVAAGNYSVVITDANGCTETLSGTVPGSSDVPDADVMQTGSLGCAGNSVTLMNTGSSTGANIEYTWTDETGTVIASGPNADQISVDMAGTYTLTVTNTSNGCFATAPVSLANNGTQPDADAGTEQTLTCTAQDVQLNGTASSNGADIVYEWTGPAGAIIQNGTTNVPTVDLPGTYTLTVTDTGNGCTNTATVTVGDNMTDPTVSIAAPAAFDCDTEDISIDASGSSTGAFTYQWTTTGTGTILGATTLTPTVNAPGEYQLLITDNVNGCTATETVTIADDSSYPSVVIAAADVITCAADTIQLDATASDSGADYSVQWTGGALIDAGTLTPSVTNGGTYTLTITDNATGCQTQETVTVSENTTPPVAAVDTPSQITCGDPTVTLTTTGSSAGANISYEWSVLTGTGTLSDPSGATTSVDGPGTYQLIVTDTDNGCSAGTQVTVTGDPATPVAEISADNNLTCEDDVANITGAGSSIGSDFVYSWTLDGVTMDGEVSFSLNNLTQPGTYELTVTNTVNGCEDTAALTITSDMTPPAVVTAAATDLDCLNEEVTLSGAGSETGDDIIYSWTTNDGTIISGADSLAATVGTAAVYYLNVVNTETGCTATDSVTVASNEVLPNIEITAPNAVTCTDETQTISAMVSATGTDILYEWTGPGLTAGQDSAMPTVNAGGTYTLTATDQTNGCVATETVTVTEEIDLPTADAGQPANITCIDETLELNAGASSGIGTLNYMWTTTGGGIIDADADTATPTVSASGTYTVLVTDESNGCTQTAQVVIGEDTAVPTATAGDDDQFNCGDASLTLNGTGSSTGDVTYLWTATNGGAVTPGTENSLSIDIEAAGTYILQVTDNTNGCTATDEVVVTLDENTPVVNVTAGGNITCLDNTVALDATIDNAGTDFDFNWTIVNGEGNFSAGETTLTPEVDAPGTYVLNVINNGNNCEGTYSITIEDQTDAPAIALTVVNSLDCNNPNTVLDTDGTDAGADFTLSWVNDAGEVIADNTENPTVGTGGNYTLTVTNNLTGCTNSETVNVAENSDAPLVVLSADEEITCLTDEVSVTTTGTSEGDQFIYEWIDTATGEVVSEELALSVSEEGDYQLTVTNQNNGCQTAETVSVTQDAAFPTAMIAAADDLDCDTSETDLDGTGSATGDDIVYTWTVISGSGMITAGGTTLQPTVDGPGVFELTVTNLANNCVSTAQVTVNESADAPAVVLAVSDEITCINEEVILNTTGSDTADNFTLVWTNDAGVVIADGTTNPSTDAEGTYTLTVTNTDNNCSSSATVNVTSDTEQPDAVIADADALTCEDTEVPLIGIGSSAGSEFSYTWTNLTTGETVGTELNITVDQQGDYQLEVLNENNGCTNTAFTTVETDADFPTVEIATADELNCIVQELTLDGAGSSEGDDIIYEWTVVSGAGSITAGANTLTPTIAGAGVYELTVTNTANDCAGTQQIAVTEDLTEPTLTVGEPDVLTCTENETTLNVTSPDATEFMWTSSETVTNPDTAMPTVGAAGIYTVTAVHTETGCEGTATVTVLADMDLPTVEAGTDYLIDCETNTVTLSAVTDAGNPLFVWTDESGNEYNGQSVEVSAGGVYTLTVTDQNSECVNADETFVQSEQPTALAANITDADCVTGLGSLVITDVEGGTPGYSYSVDGGETFMQSSAFAQLQAGNYHVVVQDLNGCEYGEEVVIEAPEELTLVMEDMVNLKLGESYDFDALINKNEDILVSLVWTPTTDLSCDDCLNPTAAPRESVRYTLSLRDSLGCSAEASTLIVVDRQSEVFIPSAFSPNGEGQNEIFMIYANENSVEQILSFQVYNRWGETVHEFYQFPPNDPTFGWNGTYRNQPMNTGVFAYKAEVLMTDGRVEMFKGDVTLMK